MKRYSFSPFQPIKIGKFVNVVVKGSITHALRHRILPSISVELIGSTVRYTQ